MLNLLSIVFDIKVLFLKKDRCLKNIELGFVNFICAMNYP